MGRSSGGGGRSSSGGGGLDQTPLGEPIEETFFGGRAGMSDLGDLITFESGTFNDPGQIDIGGARPDAAMVKAFDEGKVNVSPALIKEVGFEQYVAADPTSARMIASAKASGRGAELQAIVTPNNKTQDKIISSMRSAEGSPLFAKVGSRTSGSGQSQDSGSTIVTRLSEVSGGRPTASQSQIDTAAKNIRQGIASSGGGRPWVPVPVREVRGKYVAIGSSGANTLAVARRANVEPWLFVVE